MGSGAGATRRCRSRASRTLGEVHLGQTRQGEDLHCLTGSGGLAQDTGEERGEVGAADAAGGDVAQYERPLGCSSLSPHGRTMQYGRPDSRSAASPIPLSPRMFFGLRETMGMSAAAAATSWCRRPSSAA